MTNKQSHTRHYLIVFAAFMCWFTCAGTALIPAGVFFPPVLKAFHIGKAPFALWLTIAQGLGFFLLPFFGRLAAKKDLRLVFAIAPICFFVGQMIFSFAANVWYFYLGAIFIGVGGTISFYLYAPVLITRWFKTRVATMIGISVLGTAVAGIVVPPFALSLITNYGWQSAYRVLAFIPLVVCLPLTLLAVRSHPSDIGLRMYGDTGDADTSTTRLEGVTAATAMKSPAFYFMFVFAMLISLGFGINNYLPSYAATLPIAKAVPTIVATILSAAMLGQALGKFFLGVVADKRIMLAVAISMGGGVAGILLLSSNPNTQLLILAPSFLYGLMAAASAVLAPAVARRIFGELEYPKIWARISMGTSLAGALHPTLLGALLDATHNNYTVLWVVGILLAVSALIIASLALKQGEKLERVLQEAAA